MRPTTRPARADDGDGVLPDRWAQGGDRRSFVAELDGAVLGHCRGVDSSFHPGSRTFILQVDPDLPLGAVGAKALAAGDSWRVLAEADTLAALWNTLRFSAMAVLQAAALGILHACLVRRAPWVRGLTFLPFMVSPVCVAFGVLLLYPDWTASLPLLIATYALLAYPFVAKDVSAAWDALPPDYADAARSMGASRFQTALYVTAPLLKPALRRGLTFAAATCAGEFAATLFLSRPEWQTLTTLIYRYLGTAGADNYARAMVLTAVLMAVALAIFLVLDAEEGRKAV